MINTVGLLLNRSKEFHFNPSICIDDIVKNVKFLRKQNAYFPYIEWLPDDKLRIEFCPAKLLYGNNLYEITSDDMPDVLCNLSDLLYNAHIITCPAHLYQAHVYRIDYAKLCYLLFSSSVLLPYLQDIRKGGHYKQALTFYADDGHMVAGSLKSRKVAFYNKTAEILQDKNMPTNLKDTIRDLPGTFYRFECSLKTAKEIRRELHKWNISVNSCCLKELVTPRIIATVLQQNLTQSIAHWHVPDKQSVLEKLSVWLEQYAYKQAHSLLTDMVYALACVNVGVEQVRKVIEDKLGKRHARDFMKRFEKLALADTHCVAVFKEKFMKEVQTLNPLNKTYLDGLTRKEIVTDSDTRLFAPVLLAIVELLISTPLG